MLSTFSYEMMKHCMQERPIQKNKNNSIIEMGAVKRKPPVSKDITNKQSDSSHLNKRDVGLFSVT
jgi:hypothetical protein